MNNEDKSKDKDSEEQTWTEQLGSHFDKLQETLQASWDNIKVLPPDLLDGDHHSPDNRNPVPADLLDSVNPCEFTECVRYVGNAPLPLDFGGKPINVLTVSSGGAKGAYGAGLVTGWAEKGDMPTFDLMMGVSTGAIIALFTFIGKTEALHAFYNDYRTDDLVKKFAIPGIMSGSSIYDNSQLKELLQYYIDDVVVTQLADESRKGRVLLIGSTNLDRRLPVTWDLTAIARTNSPFARQLIADVMLASCAIPVVFPPVLFSVADEATGQEYDELHIDGAASFQLLIDVPAENANVYAIVNKYLIPPYRASGTAIFDIGTQSLSSALTNGIIGDMYRLYAHAQRKNNAFHATWIPETFTDTPDELFDIDYMRKLFEVGRECARLGKVWHNTPPYFA